jgi:hypothetical protein
LTICLLIVFLYDARGGREGKVQGGRDGSFWWRESELSGGRKGMRGGLRVGPREGPRRKWGGYGSSPARKGRDGVYFL